MALSTNTQIEVRTGGSDTNGGGFLQGASGTDWTLQNSPQYASTDIVTNGTTTITSATANWGTDVVGNVIYIAGGTGAIVGNWYEVMTRTSSTALVVDRSTGLTAGTGATGNLGGALATLGGMGEFVNKVGISSLRFWIKSGTYTLTSVTNNVSGGSFFLTTADNMKFEGYETTRGDRGAMPVFHAGALTSFTVVSGGTTRNGCKFVNLEVNGNSNSTVRGFDDGGRRSFFIGCTARNCTNIGFNHTGGALNLYCASIGHSSQPAFNFSATNGVGCVARNGTSVGFSTANTVLLVDCIAYNNTGATTDGYSCARVLNCTAFGNGRDGFRITNSEGNVLAINCVSEGNGGWGFNGSSTLRAMMAHNRTFNNTSGGINTNLLGNDAVAIDNQVYTTTAFTNSAGGDFSLNNTATGGALCRAQGFPTTFLSTSTPNYPDIGLAQAQPSAGGGVGGFFMQ